jgi:very-short-patch-repair endonuclease
VKLSYQEIKENLKSYQTKILTTENEYQNVRQKLTLICSQCDKEYSCSFFDFKRKDNKTCQPCAKKNSGQKKIISINKNEFDIFDDIEIILIKDKYQREEKIKCQCLKCQHIFDEKYHILLRKKNKNLSSCSRCNMDNKNKKLRKETFEKTKQFCQDNDIKFVSTENEFVNGDEYFICEKCQSKFHRPHKYFNKETYPMRTGMCQKCSQTNTVSNEERIVKDFLTSLNIDFTENDRTILNGKELDIYIPNHKLAIEINGLYHHSELKGVDKNYHLNKTVMCEKQNIQLLHFWDYEINNKFEIVKSIIKSKLNRLDKKIGARKLQIQVIEHNQALKFMNDNHLHGFCVAKHHIALTDDKEIVSMISLGKSRTDNNWEIIRFATLNGVQVIGGYSKLISYIRNKMMITNIISFADRRLSNGDLYLKSGWQLISISNPCYWYFKNKKIFHRSSFMKHKLKSYPEFDHDLTEWQIMIKMGYDRIWDCGNLKFKT